MPRDKAATNAKIIQYMREEFFTYGYEKASLNRISAKVGISTAALYKHFKNKEDMFYFLVRDTLDAFHEQTDNSRDEMNMIPEYNPFKTEWALFWVDFIYDHYDGMKLLICCSDGSPFESFEDDLIELETRTNKEYMELLRRSGKTTKNITDMQWHILSTAYIHLLFEVVRHDMDKTDAIEHARFISHLLFPGWEKIFGL